MSSVYRINSVTLNRELRYSYCLIARDSSLTIPKNLCVHEKRVSFLKLLRLIIFLLFVL